MKVINLRKGEAIRYGDLKPGDCYSASMDDYTSIRIKGNYRLEENWSNNFVSIDLKTGIVYDLKDDYEVTKVEVEAYIV